MACHAVLGDKPEQKPATHHRIPLWQPVHKGMNHPRHISNYAWGYPTNRYGFSNIAVFSALLRKSLYPWTGKKCCEIKRPCIYHEENQPDGLFGADVNMKSL